MSKKIISRAKKTIAIELSGVREQLKHINSGFVKSVETINSCRGRVVVIGVGKSGLIGRKIVATFSSIGVPSIFVHPTELIHGDLGMILPEDTVIILSYSGESEEIKKILPMLKELKMKIIAITGRKKSFLAKFADFVIDVSVDKEACPFNLVPTASTTAMLVIGDALAMSVGELRGFKKEDYARLHPGGTLGKKLNLKVNQIMHSDRDNPVINQNATVGQALIVMTEKKLGATSVVDGRGRLTGYFTDGDLRRKLQSDSNILKRKLNTIMTKSPKIITGDALASEAAETMKKYNCDNLPVIDNKRRVIGMIDERDLIAIGIK